MYRIITEKEGRIRKDIVYTETGKGGYGMTEMEEEYKINRMRGMMQILQTGDRQAGRGQQTWLQEALIEELKEEEPSLEIIGEMKEIMEDMEMNWEETEKTRHRPWDMQKGWKRVNK